MTSAKPSARRGRKAAPKPEAAETPAPETTAEGNGVFDVLSGLKATTNQHAANVQQNLWQVSRIPKAAEYEVKVIDNRARIVGLPCPKCGATHIPDTDRPAISIVPSRNFPSQSPRFACESCGEWNCETAELFEVLFPSFTDRQRHLDRHYSGHRVKRGRWITAKHGGKTSRLEAEAEEAIAQLKLRPSVREVGLCAVTAIGKEQAAAGILDVDLPFKRVRIDENGMVAERWNDLPQTVTEKSRLREVLRREALQKRGAVDRELDAMRTRLEREAGLR